MKPPYYALNFLKPQFLVNTEGYPHDVFPQYDTKKIRRKNVILSPTHDLSSIVFFHTTNYLKNKGFPHEDFRHCETKDFGRKIVRPPPPPFLLNFFPYHKFSETQKGSPTKFFGTARQKTSDEKT